MPTADPANERGWLSSMFGGLNDFIDGLATSRSAAPAPPPAAPPAAGPPDKKNEGVVYLGLNPASREHEKAAFAGQDNATIITGSGTDPAMDGKVRSKDGKRVFDLASEDDLRAYFAEIGVDKVRTDADGKPIETQEEAWARRANLEDVFLGAENEDGRREGGISVGARDEMAQFVDVLQRVEAGEMTMDRLVMSGHSTGEWIYGEGADPAGVSFKQMAALMNLYPKAQNGVEELMLSACHTLEDSRFGDTRDGKQYQQMFPELTNVWGYDGVSPSHEQGSTRHIQKWLDASEGHDPHKVEDAAKRAGQNAKELTY